MASERTEEPTPKRLEEARRRGEVAFSRDATESGLSQPRFGRKFEVAISWPPTSLSSSVCLMYGMTRWE